MITDEEVSRARQSLPRRTYRQAVEDLAAGQKPGKGAPAYSRVINRRLGRRLAAVAYLLGLTPNLVTAFSAFFSFSAIALLAVTPGEPSWGFVIAFLLVAGYALDAADGQLARLRGGGTKAGEWLDHMVDAAKISSLHAAVLIHLFRHDHHHTEVWLLVPVGFLIVANVMFFATLLNDLLRRISVADAGGQLPVMPVSALRSLVVLPTDYGIMCLLFILLGWTDAFVDVYTFLFLCSAGFLAAASVKWFREMASLN